MRMSRRSDSIEAAADANPFGAFMRMAGGSRNKAAFTLPPHSYRAFSYE